MAQMGWVPIIWLVSEGQYLLGKKIRDARQTVDVNDLVQMEVVGETWAGAAPYPPPLIVQPSSVVSQSKKKPTYTYNVTFGLFWRFLWCSLHFVFWLFFLFLNLHIFPPILGSELSFSWAAPAQAGLKALPLKWQQPRPVLSSPPPPHPIISRVSGCRRVYLPLRRHFYPEGRLLQFHIGPFALSFILFMSSKVH